MTKDAIQEIARMQYIIDSYETSLMLLAGMCKNKKDVAIPSFQVDSPWIETIYEFIRDHINESVRIKVNQDDCVGLHEVYEKWKERRKSK